MPQDQTGNTVNRTQAIPWAAVMAQLINTSEVRKILAEVSTAWLRDWSDGHVLKKAACKPASWVAVKSLLGADTTDLSSVFEKPEHIEALSRQLPAILHGLSEIARCAVNAVDQMPIHRKRALFSQLFAARDAGSSGDVHQREGLVAALSHTLGNIYVDDPDFFSKILFPWIEHWVASTDFGELKNLLDTTRNDLEILLRQISGVLFEYPAKLIALLSLIPDGINLLISLVHGILEHLNALPPDILTDLSLSLIKQVDAATIGQSINRINEAIRQFHTGSALIGEMDAPQFTSDMKEKIRAVVAEIDPEPAIKARNALIEGRETLISILIDTALDHPDYLNLWLHQLTVKRNANIRLLKQKLHVFEMLPEQEADQALAAGLSSWNAYDLAELVNTLGRTVNRLNRIKPDLLTALVSEFVNSLDLYELEETMAWVSRDLGHSIRPLFRMMAPPVVQELCKFFEPEDDDDGYDDAMLQARQRLRQLLLGKEGTP